MPLRLRQEIQEVSRRGKIEQFSNSRAVSGIEQGGFFLRKKPLSINGLPLQQLENRYSRGCASFHIRLWFPVKVIYYPLPGSVVAEIGWRWWRSRSWKSYRLSSVGICQLLEYPALLLDSSIVGEHAERVFQRVECKFSIHIMAIPISEPPSPCLNRRGTGCLEPLRLLLLLHLFDAGIELPGPDRFLGICC